MAEAQGTTPFTVQPSLSGFSLRFQFYLDQAARYHPMPTIIAMPIIQATHAN